MFGSDLVMIVSARIRFLEVYTVIPSYMKEPPWLQMKFRGSFQFWFKYIHIKAHIGINGLDKLAPILLRNIHKCTFVVDRMYQT
jgi:hypothetical protein